MKDKKNEGSMFLTSLNIKAGRGSTPQNTQTMKSAVVQANSAYNEFEKLTKSTDVVTEYSVISNAVDNFYSQMPDAASYYSKFVYGSMPLNKPLRLRLYREMAQFPEVSDALDEICESCTSYKDESGQIIKVTFPKQCPLSDKQMKKVTEEFDDFISLFDFESNGFEYFLHFAIDGEITWENVIDGTNPKKGIVGINSIKPECYEQILSHQGKQVGIMVNVSIVPTNNPNPIDINKVSGVGAIGGGLQDGPVYYQNGRATLNDIIALPMKQITHINSGSFDQGGMVVVPILEKARRAYRQLMSIEDAIIIYRLIRAPERLVFNVDVGQASVAKAEQMLNRMKEQYNVKHMYDPSIGSVTTNYDPHQMLECISLFGMIPLLDGRTITLAQIIEEFNQGKELWAYSCCPTTGRFSPGKISWAGITRQNAKVVKVTFDNGKSIVCTPDHPFPVWKKGKVEAQDLIPDDSVISFNTAEQRIGHKNMKSKRSAPYKQVFDHELNDWVFVHQVVAKDCDIPKFIFDEQKCKGHATVVHHKDFNRYNNSPTNLVKMDGEDHFVYHSKNAHARWENPENIRIIKEQKSHKFSIDLGNELIRLMRDNKIYELKDVANFINTKDTTFINQYRKLHEKNNNCEYVSGSIQHKYLLNLVKYCGFGTYRDFRRFVNPQFRLGDVSRTRTYSHEMLKDLIDLVNDTGLKTILDIVDYVNTKDPNCQLMQTFKQTNNACTKDIGQLSRKHLTNLIKYCGFNDFRSFIKNKDLHNHRVISVEALPDTMDTGTITIDQNHDIHEYHTFATDAGVYTYNSYWFSKPANSTGTEVSTLAGGQNLGQLDDLLYFQKKLYTALKVPYSRRDATAGTIQNNDDITPEELRFAQFVMRVQGRFSKGIKESFRTHLELRGIWQEYNIQSRYYNVEFTPPTNYELRQKHKLVQAKVDTYMLLADRPEIAQEIAQREFLCWSQEKIDENNKHKEKEKLRNALIDYKVAQITQTGKYEEDPPPPDEEPPPSEEETPIPDETATEPEAPAPEESETPEPEAGSEESPSWLTKPEESEQPKE